MKFNPFIESERLTCPSCRSVTVAEAVLALGGELRAESLGELRSAGVEFALVGLPEDIGVRANFGRPGAASTWSYFLPRFLAAPAPSCLDKQNLAILGALNFDELQKEAEKLSPQNSSSLKRLRELCTLVDERVTELSLLLFQAGLTPIFIGGGHNNSFPILRALSQFKQQAVRCLNIDAHADLRDLEGRHSGNGFSYAYQDSFLEDYFVFGLREFGCSREQRSRLDEFSYVSQESLLSESDWEKAMERAGRFVSSETSVGLELDFDVIENFPSSAPSMIGLRAAEAQRILLGLCKEKEFSYFHLCEAAPNFDTSGDERRVAGALSAFIFSILQAHQTAS